MGLVARLLCAPGRRAPTVAYFLRRWAWIGLYLLVSAYLLAESSSRPMLAPISCLALLPLFIVIRFFSSTRVAILAGFWGASHCLLLAACYPSTTELTLGSAGAVTLLPALFAFASKYTICRLGCSVVLLPFGWVLLNVLSGALGVQAGLLSGSIVSGSVFAGVAGFGGWAVVALMVAAISTLLVSVVCGVEFCLVTKPWLYYREKIAATCSQYIANLTQRIVTLCTSPRGPPAAVAAVKVR